MSLRSVMAIASLGRAAFGAAFLVAPEPVGTRWLGSVAEDDRVGILLRAVGGRDVALGLGTLLAQRHGAPVRGWLEGSALAGLLASAGCDAIDLAATLGARGDLPESNVRVTAVLAAGSAVLFGAAAAAMDP
jgi:hypothetical protein